MHQKETIHSFVNMQREEMSAMWENFVNTPSQARDQEAANAMCLKLKGIFEEIGFECSLREVGPVNAKALIGVWGKERSGDPIIFSGHYDTVSLPGEHHFRIDKDGKAHGLACLDMKGGIVIAIYVIKALQSMGWAERPIKFIFLGDEEKGHQQADTPKLIIEEAKGALCAFNMETGLISNKICIGRKGGGVANFTVKGVGAHSGNDFLKGRNAIAEMASKILDLQALTDLEKGTTVSVTIIKGGTVPNGIPPECAIDVDVRYEILSEHDRVLTSFAEISKKVYIDGCTTTFNYNEYMAAFETTPDGIALADFVAKVSRDTGFGEMGQTRLGGGSDASYITISKVPTVCSMGVMGEFNHTDKEYALVESLFKRTELLTNVVLRINEFANR